ncbi:MAG: RagB/SusD family nutrient uptake outer membrane protein [Bacteroidales bacterium]|jgi:hypothetical protein|nr:RagB/SusD family nutrient uptake outer membrane protein [Bacteroidales bacterium]
MKKYLIIFSLLIAGMLNACSDFLEPKPDNTMTEEEVFANAAYFCGPLMAAYNSLPANFDIAMETMTDNAVNNQLSGDYYLCSVGALRPNHNPLDNWTGDYQQIRRINQFLEQMVLNFDNPVPTPVRFYLLQTPQDSIDNVRVFYRLLGEAHFMRAYYLADLLKRFGGVAADGTVLGVPLIGDRVLEITEDLNFPRAPYDDCVQAIVSDCDSAIKYLPVEYKGDNRVTGLTMNGRASGIAARALKARVLLYAASPAFNPTNDRLRWEKAAIAAGDAIKAVGGGFQNLVQGGAGLESEPYYFGQLQNVTWADNGRDLFFRANVVTGQHVLEGDNYPQSMYGSAINGPSQNFVDAFPDNTGYPIGESTVYDAENPYANRDPRLAYFVAFNGSAMGPANHVARHTIASYKGGEDAYVPLNKTSRTSYYLKKLLRHGTVSLVPNNIVNTARAHILLGKPELYLNFAEAANEAWGVNNDPEGLSFTAAAVLKKIHLRYWRTANGDTYLNNVIVNDQDLFRAYVRNERRIELSFEGHYYFDLRRWIPYGTNNAAALNVDVRGMEITKNDDGTFTYNPNVLLETRYFASPFQPIPYMELYNSSNIVQNYGWE